MIPNAKKTFVFFFQNSNYAASTKDRNVFFQLTKEKACGLTSVLTASIVCPVVFSPSRKPVNGVVSIVWGDSFEETK